MEYERSVITITLLRLDYRVHGPGNYADDTLTKTSLINTHGRAQRPSEEI